MSVAPDPAELAPSRDPAAYGRRQILSPAFWAMVSLAVLCILAGAAVVGLAPRFFGARAPAPPSIAAAPAPSPDVGAAAPPAYSGAGLATPIAPPEIAALQGRVERLETGEGRALDAASAALAASALSEAAEGAAPFTGELAAYQRILPGSTAARALAPLAAQGAPTRAELASELGAISAGVATAARQPGRHASILDQFIYAVSRVVTVRRVDGAGSGPDAALARAERSAGDGDLATALADLRTVTPTAAGPLREWRDKAARRVSIDRDVEALRGEALADLEAAREGR